MKQIKTFGLTNLLASASLEFHNSAHNVISSFGAIVATLGNLITDYQASIQLQQRAGNKDKRLANTRAIAEKDKVRDAYLNRFFKSVSDLLISPVAGEKAAAQIIDDAISRFRGLSGYEMNKQTGEVKNMIITLRQQQIWNAAVQLGLDHLAEQIDSANADFESEMNTRIEDESQKEKLNTSQQRKATEKIYAQIVQKINAVAIVTPSAETDGCIDKLNALIEEYERTISSMRSGGAGNEKRKKKDSSMES